MRFLAVAFAGLVGLAGAAHAQDAPAGEPPFRPSNEQIDENLDRTLEREYDPDHPPPPATEPTPAPAPTAPVVHHHHQDDRFHFGLGGYAAHLYSAIRDVRVGKRHGVYGTSPIRLDGGAAVADFDPEHSQTYKAWIDFGKHVSLEGGYRRTVFRSQMASGQTFTFDRTTFGRNEQLGVSIDTLTADLDLVIKPINNRWVSLDLHLGSRYLFWRTEMQGSQATRTGRSTLEAAIPVVGAGLAVRPLRFLELFARGRVGYLSYDRPESNTYRNGRRIDHVSAKEKTVKSAELDVGLQLLIKDTIGVIAGWRADYFRFERGTEGEEEEARGMVYGVYAGVVLQF